MENRFRMQYEKFQTSRQEPLRLSIALEAFVRRDCPAEYADAYLAYLRRRIRPAIMALVRQDDSRGLAALAETILLPGEAVDAALSLASAENKTAALVWLLRYKQKTTGFPDRDLRL